MNDPRHAVAEAGRRLHALGMSPGASGNISVRTPHGILVTPTGRGLDELTQDGLAALDADGAHTSGAPPTKEVPLHLALYARDPSAQAVVHLHSTHAVAVSCLEPDDPHSCLPPLTAYFVMRVGRTPLIPYAAPGDRALAAHVRAVPFTFRAALLANHGLVVTGADVEQAVLAAIEVEETARLHLLLHGRRARPLGPAQIADLATRHNVHWPTVPPAPSTGGVQPSVKETSGRHLKPQP
ncbi:aldolase [Streptomyces sp. NPDC047009]|uniref:class II aldolase/adducin family protein n=1 Tax=Streptomyces sp. NPDC047009 TaxID=3154496 RepID=UPI0033F5448F